MELLLRIQLCCKHSSKRFFIKEELVSAGRLVYNNIFVLFNHVFYKKKLVESKKY